MKLIFTQRVRDIKTYKLYEVGEIVEVSDDRGADFISASVATEIIEKKPTEEKPKKATKKIKKEE